MTRTHHERRWLTNKAHMRTRPLLLDAFAYRKLCDRFSQDDWYLLIHANRGHASRAEACQFERDLE